MVSVYELHAWMYMTHSDIFRDKRNLYVFLAFPVSRTNEQHRRQTMAVGLAQKMLCGDKNEFPTFEDGKLGPEALAPWQLLGTHEWSFQQLHRSQIKRKRKYVKTM